MIFKEHGVFEVKVEGKVLLVDATGPFNKELIVKYEKALESCIQHLEVSRWNQIITLHDFSLFTPEAEKALTESLICRKKRGLVACAVLLVDIEGRSLVTTQLNHCYNNAKIPHKFMPSIDQAKTWLESLLR